MFYNIKTFVYFIFFSLLCVVNSDILAQINFENNFKFDRITSEKIKIERGLSQNTVFCINQDQKGYMWFGTWDGLNKFDGYDFTVFKHNFNDDDGSISDQTIRVIYFDKSGTL